MSGYFYKGKPVTNSFGVLTYEDTAGNKCSDEGIFSDQLRLSGIGKRNQGEKDKVIGLFSNGNIDHHIILEKDAILYKKEMKIADDEDEDRYDIRFTGHTFNEKPVSKSYAVLTYKRNDSWFTEKGSFDDKLMLSGIGRRKERNNDTLIICNDVGEWTNGNLCGDGLRKFINTYGYKAPDDEYGTFRNNKLQNEV